MLIFDKTKLRRFVAYVESVAAKRAAGEEAMADVIFTLMRDESRLTAERATVFSRTSEHAKYMKHLIKDCRDAIIPALVEVQDFVGEITTTKRAANKGSKKAIKSSELKSLPDLIDAHIESSNKAQSVFACLLEMR